MLFNDLYRYTFFFSARHRRAAGTSFFFVGNQELIRSEAPLSSRLQVTHARCIFFYAVVIAVERSRRVCARSFRRVEKKMGEGGQREKKKKNSRTLYTHDAPFLVARRGQNAPRRPNYYPRRVLAIVRGIPEKSRYPARSRREKNISPSCGGEEREREKLFHFECTPSEADLVPRSSTP